MSVTTRRFAVATLLTGVIAGLVGLACIHLLHWIQALAWDMHSGTLLEAVSAASPARRVLNLVLGGILGAASWFFLFRRSRAITSVSAAVGGTPMPPLRATWHALTQVLIVGLGASVGREVAPREMAAAFCTSAIAVLISTGFTRPTPFYSVPTLTPSLSLTVFAALVGPLLGATGWAFKQAVTRVGAARPRDWRLLATLPTASFLVGVIAVWVPSVLGNGQASAQTQFDAVWATGAGLGLAALVLAAKTVTTFLTIRAGGWGGVLTPAVALGAGIGADIGLPRAAAWPGSQVAAFAFIGAAAFLGASMNAPFTGLILVIEFTAQGPTILVPATLAVGGATAATAWLSRRSLSSAR